MAFDDPTVAEEVRGTILAGEMGDVELTWGPENDDKILPLIEKKMAEGVNFFFLKPVVGDLLHMRRKLTKMSDLTARNVKIKDADIEALFTAGDLALVRSSGELETKGRAKTAREVVRGRTVGVPALQGG